MEKVPSSKEPKSQQLNWIGNGGILICGALAFLFAAQSKLNAQGLNVGAIDQANAEAVRLKREGEYTQGAELAQKTLERAEKELGSDHPSTIKSLENLAALYARLHRNWDARPLFERAWQTRQRVVEKERPDTMIKLEPLRQTGTQLVRMGQLKTAEQAYKQALEISERELGREHPQTLAILLELGFVNARPEKMEEGASLLKRAFEGSKRVLGAEHPHTDRSLALRNLILAHQGRYEDAEQLIDSEFGPDHPATPQQLHDLAQYGMGKDRYEDAQRIFKHALEVGQRQLAQGYDAVCVPFRKSLDRLVAFYRNEGRVQDVEQLLTRFTECQVR